MKKLGFNWLKRLGNIGKRKGELEAIGGVDNSGNTDSIGSLDDRGNLDSGVLEKSGELLKGTVGIETSGKSGNEDNIQLDTEARAIEHKSYDCDSTGIANKSNISLEDKTGGLELEDTSNTFSNNMASVNATPTVEVELSGEEGNIGIDNGEEPALLYEEKVNNNELEAMKLRADGVKSKAKYDISKVPSRVKVNLITNPTDLESFIDAMYSNMQLIAKLESNEFIQALDLDCSLGEKIGVESDYLIQRLDGIEKHKLNYAEDSYTDTFNELLAYIEPYKDYQAMYLTFITACACIKAFLYSGYKIKEVEQVDVKGAYIRLKFKREELNTIGYMYLYKRKENRLHIVIMPSQSSELYEKRDNNSYKRNVLDNMIEDTRIIDSLNSFIDWWASGIYYSGIQ